MMEWYIGIWDSLWDDEVLKCGRWYMLYVECSAPRRKEGKERLTGAELCRKKKTYMYSSRTIGGVQ